MIIYEPDRNEAFCYLFQLADGCSDKADASCLWSDYEGEYYFIREDLTGFTFTIDTNRGYFFNWSLQQMSNSEAAKHFQEIKIENDKLKANLRVYREYLKMEMEKEEIDGTWRVQARDNLDRFNQTFGEIK